MSRIKSDKINLGSSIVVEISSADIKQEEVQEEVSLLERKENEAQLASQRIINNANLEAQTIVDRASKNAQEIINSAQIEVENAKQEVQRLIDEANNQAAQIIESANNEAVTIKESASQEGAKEGFEAGYSDGALKIREELQNKVEDMDALAGCAYEMKEKVLASSRKEIIELVLLIARKVCINNVDSKTLEGILENSVALLSDKENISLLVSEKYARLLDELGIEQLKNIKVSYNSKIADDTFIVETPEERLDGSIGAQIEQIANKFFLELNTIDSEAQDE